MNWSYFIWIPITLVYNFLIMSVAVKYNQTDFLKSYSIMVLLGLIPIPTWSMAAYFSKNLLFDNLLYDSLLVLSGPFIIRQDES